MRYAIDLGDLQGWTHHLPLMCLLDGVLEEEPFDIGSGKFASVAVRLNCEEGRAEAIWRIVRMNFKIVDMQMYRSKTGRGSWKRI